jgi:O-acetyl-ADP-ribose deacetylase (regulator of RNase III)
MLVKVILVDVRPKMVKAWRDTFEENPEVDVVHGSMLEQQTTAWVTPTNARGSMDGGLDAVIKNHLGQVVETRLQQRISSEHGGALPIGHAVCNRTDKDQPRFLISTPTMVGSSDDVSASMNVALACAAAFQAVNMQNRQEPGSIRSVALPGLGANTGRVPVEICADLMWTGYNLFRDQDFATYAELRAALEEQLGDLTPMSDSVSMPKQPAAAAPAAPAADDDLDFDDDDFSDDDDFDDFE